MIKCNMIPILIVAGDRKLAENYLHKSIEKPGDLVFEIKPLEKEYSISDIKALIKETKNFHPKRRVYFLADFHSSSIPAQNSFLKLLEEPPNQVQFVLSTLSENALLPTIISRIKMIKLIGKKSLKIDQSLANDFQELIKNKSFNVLGKKNFSQVKRDEALKIIDQMIIFFRERMAIDEKSPEVIKEMIRLKNLLENNNLNPQLTVDQVLIFIFKKYSMK